MTAKTSQPPHRICAEPLTAGAFAPFGQVLGPGIGASRLIRDGAVRLTATPPCLDHCDTARTASIDIYEVTGVPTPVLCTQVERHPLSAQMFMPITPGRWLITVWPDAPDTAPRAFVAGAGQGVVYARGLWHQGIVALDRDMQFLSMMFRGDGTQDTEFRALPRPVAIEAEGA